MTPKEKAKELVTKYCHTKEDVIKAYVNGCAEFDTGAFRDELTSKAEQYYKQQHEKE